MGSRSAEIDGQPTADSTPEDVAVLYSWANLQGAKYRDYSASRREYRAQVRYRAAKALLERELKAQIEAEAAVAEAERAALSAEAMAHLHGSDSQASRIPSPRSAEAAKTKAAAERVEAARRAEAAAQAAVRTLREQREIAEAHSSARRQALIYAESELRRRQLAGPQPRGPLGEPYAVSSNGPGDLRGEGPGNPGQSLSSGWQISAESTAETSSVAWQPLPGEDTTIRVMEEPFGHQAAAGDSGAEKDGARDEGEQTAPAWLFSSQIPKRMRVSQAISQAYRGDAPGGDTLQDSRERVAARWFALKGVFENEGPELPAIQPMRPGNAQTPLLAVFSLAGGVGKTSLVATLGRALASQGEKVVLTDTTSHGLLPIYFGAHEILPGVVRTFSPPAEKTDQQPISVVIHDFVGSEDDRAREMLTEEILRSGQGNHRLLVDLSTGSSWLVRRVVDLQPTVLVPVAPDMNSVISLQAVERLFRGITDSEGRPLLPFYVLNQFDASLPLHLDVREVFRRQLGDRLLRFAIRRSPAVSEALAEGMTVLDYAPVAPVAQDYLDVAMWLRSVSPAATAKSPSVHWGDR
jgi:cellulose synthase operon protein YhjQ